ncbi:MAG: hypothetical protein IPL97_04865 [Niastella sp.]|nr:hypothetical protein [Niastella sp.]
MDTKSNNQDSSKKKIYGNPEYGAKQDIYNREEKIPFNDKEMPKEQDGNVPPLLDEGLDVPGASLDDADELIGEEDEENNYYSLGGDAHNDLEESKDK